MTINPFEPPRAVEETAAAAAVTGDGAEVPSAAIDELVKSAPWARWAAIAFIVGSACNVLESLAKVVMTGKSAHLGAAIGGATVSIPMAVLFWWVSRRYYTNAARLPAGGRAALAEVIAAQRALFTGMGVITLAAIGLVMLAIGAGIAIAWFMRR